MEQILPAIFTSDGEREAEEAQPNESRACNEIEGEPVLLEKLNALLAGIPPPPSLATCRLSHREILEKISENKHLLDLPTIANPVSYQTPKVYLLNSGAVSEDIASLMLKIQARFVQCETLSTCTSWFESSLPLTASAKKRRQIGQGISPGRRLSHLARRRQVFSRANLQRLAQNDANNHRLAIKATDSSQRLKNFIENRRLLQPAVPKRALFQSPDEEPTRPGFRTVPKHVPRRKLFGSGDKEQALQPPIGNGRYDVSGWIATQNFNGARKRMREDARNSDSKRRCPRRSLNFSDSSPSRYSEASTLDSTSQNQPLSTIHKKKLLWAVSFALKERSITHKDPLFKSCATVLFNMCKKSFSAIRCMSVQGGTSERILNFARQTAPEIIAKEKGKSGVLKDVSNSALNTADRHGCILSSGKENSELETPKKEVIAARPWKSCLKSQRKLNRRLKRTRSCECISFDKEDNGVAGEIKTKANCPHLVDLNRVARQLYAEESFEEPTNCENNHVNNESNIAIDVGQALTSKKLEPDINTLPCGNIIGDMPDGNLSAFVLEAKPVVELKNNISLSETNVCGVIEQHVDNSEVENSADAILSGSLEEEQSVQFPALQAINCKEKYNVLFSEPLEVPVTFPILQNNPLSAVELDCQNDTNSSGGIDNVFLAPFSAVKRKLSLSNENIFFYNNIKDENSLLNSDEVFFNSANEKTSGDHLNHFEEEPLDLSLQSTYELGGEEEVDLFENCTLDLSLNSNLLPPVLFGTDSVNDLMTNANMEERGILNSTRQFKTTEGSAPQTPNPHVNVAEVCCDYTEEPHESFSKEVVRREEIQIQVEDEVNSPILGTKASANEALMDQFDFEPEVIPDTDDAGSVVVRQITNTEQEEQSCSDNLFTSTPLQNAPNKLVMFTKPAWKSETGPGLTLRMRLSKVWGIAGRVTPVSTPETSGEQYSFDESAIETEESGGNANVSTSGAEPADTSTESYYLMEIRDRLAIEKTLKDAPSAESAVPSSSDFSNSNVTGQSSSDIGIGMNILNAEVDCENRDDELSCLNEHELNTVANCGGMDEPLLRSASEMINFAPAASAAIENAYNLNAYPDLDAEVNQSRDEHIVGDLKYNEIVDASESDIPTPYLEGSLSNSPVGPEAEKSTLAINGSACGNKASKRKNLRNAQQRRTRLNLRSCKKIESNVISSHNEPMSEPSSELSNEGLTNSLLHVTPDSKDINVNPCPSVPQSSSFEDDLPLIVLSANRKKVLRKTLTDSSANAMHNFFPSTILRNEAERNVFSTPIKVKKIRKRASAKKNSTHSGSPEMSGILFEKFPSSDSSDLCKESNPNNDGNVELTVYDMQAKKSGNSCLDIGNTKRVKNDFIETDQPIVFSHSNANASNSILNGPHKAQHYSNEGICLSACSFSFDDDDLPLIELLRSAHKEKRTASSDNAEDGDVLSIYKSHDIRELKTDSLEVKPNHSSTSEIKEHSTDDNVFNNLENSPVTISPQKDDELGGKPASLVSLSSYVNNAPCITDHLQNIEPCSNVDSVNCSGEYEDDMPLIKLVSSPLTKISLVRSYMKADNTMDSTAVGNDNANNSSQENITELKTDSPEVKVNHSSTSEIKEYSTDDNVFNNLENSPVTISPQKDDELRGKPASLVSLSSYVNNAPCITDHLQNIEPSSNVDSANCSGEYEDDMPLIKLVSSPLTKISLVRSYMETDNTMNSAAVGNDNTNNSSQENIATAEHKTRKGRKSRKYIRKKPRNSSGDRISLNLSNTPAKYNLDHRQEQRELEDSSSPASVMKSVCWDKILRLDLPCDTNCQPSMESSASMNFCNSPMVTCSDSEKKQNDCEDSFNELGKPKCHGIDACSNDNEDDLPLCRLLSSPPSENSLNSRCVETDVFTGDRRPEKIAAIVTKSSKIEANKLLKIKCNDDSTDDKLPQSLCSVASGLSSKNEREHEKKESSLCEMTIRNSGCFDSNFGLRRFCTENFRTTCSGKEEGNISFNFYEGQDVVAEVPIDDSLENDFSISKAVGDRRADSADGKQSDYSSKSAVVSSPEKDLETEVSTLCSGEAAAESPRHCNNNLPLNRLPSSPDSKVSVPSSCADESNSNSNDISVGDAFAIFKSKEYVDEEITRDDGEKSVESPMMKAKCVTAFRFAINDNDTFESRNDPGDRSSSDKINSLPTESFATDCNGFLMSSADLTETKPGLSNSYVTNEDSSETSGNRCNDLAATSEGDTSHSTSDHSLSNSPVQKAAAEDSRSTSEEEMNRGKSRGEVTPCSSSISVTNSVDSSIKRRILSFESYKARKQSLSQEKTRDAIESEEPKKIYNIKLKNRSSSHKEKYEGHHRGHSNDSQDYCDRSSSYSQRKEDVWLARPHQKISKLDRVSKWLEEDASSKSPQYSDSDISSPYSPESFQEELDENSRQMSMGQCDKSHKEPKPFSDFLNKTTEHIVETISKISELVEDQIRKESSKVTLDHLTRIHKAAFKMKRAIERNPDSVRLSALRVHKK